jgi:hypothetical protein
VETVLETEASLRERVMVLLGGRVAEVRKGEGRSSTFHEPTTHLSA